MPEHLSTAPNIAPYPKDSGLINEFENGASNQSAVTHSPTRILVSFTVNGTDLGFESVYHELSEISQGVDRMRHVKRILFNAHAGKVRDISAQRSLVPSSQHSFKIAFPVTRRDVGLCWLFDELLLLKSSFERNQHVRRLLYQACAIPIFQGKPTALPVPVMAAIKAVTEVAANQTSVISASTPMPRKPIVALTDEQLAARNEKRAQKHKQNVIMLD